MSHCCWCQYGQGSGHCGPFLKSHCQIVPSIVGYDVGECAIREATVHLKPDLAAALVRCEQQGVDLIARRGCRRYRDVRASRRGAGQPCFRSGCSDINLILGPDVKSADRHVIADIARAIRQCGSGEREYEYAENRALRHAPCKTIDTRLDGLGRKTCRKACLPWIIASTTPPFPNTMCSELEFHQTTAGSLGNRSYGT